VTFETGQRSCCEIFATPAKLFLQSHADRFSLSLYEVTKDGGGRGNGSATSQRARPLARTRREARNLANQMNDPDPKARAAATRLR